jgi:predicted Zn-dependent peptidase
MAVEPNPLPNPTPMTLDQLLAEMLRENERLRRQVEDARHERDEYKRLYLGELATHAEELTPDDVARAVPARPLIEQAIKRLEQS